MKVLWIGTSITDQSLDFRGVSEVVGCELKFLKCFTITRKDGVYRPESNLEEKLPIALSQSHYDLIIVEAGVNEVTNLRLHPDQKMKNKKAIYPRFLKLYNIVKSFASQNQRFVILKGLPRDDLDVNCWAVHRSGQLLDRFWEADSCPSTIKIENLDIKPGVDIFGIIGTTNPNTGKKCDGIHLRGSEGTLQYSRAAIEMLQRRGV